MSLETKNENRSSNSVFHYRRKTEIEMEVRIPFFSIVGKRKTKLEV